MRAVLERDFLFEAARPRAVVTRTVVAGLVSLTACMALWIGTERAGLTTDETGSAVFISGTCALLILLALLSELSDLAPAMPQERVAQEVAMLVTRSDIREELDRLRAHIAQAGDLMERGEAVGRQLDFLCQELNREANTLCSNSSDIELTRIGLALKLTVEQFREQVQNLE